MTTVFSDDEISHLSDDDDDVGSSEDKNQAEEKKEEKPDVWEDIYGRKRDKDGNIIKVKFTEYYCVYTISSVHSMFNTDTIYLSYSNNTHGS